MYFLLNQIETIRSFISHYDRTNESKTRVSQEGQGLVEYILILVLTIGIILALNRTLGQPLQQYTRNLVGDMVRCMLETGELPAQAMQVCGINVNFQSQPFDPNAAGSSLNGQGTNGNNGQTGAGNNNANNDQDGNENQGNNDGSGNNQAADGDSQAGSNGNRIRSRSPGRSRGAIDTGFDSDGVTSRKTNISTGGDLAGGGEGSFELSGQDNNQVLVRRRIIRRKGAQGIGGQFSLSGSKTKTDGFETPDRSIRRRSRVVASADNTEEALQKKPRQFKPPQPKKKKKGPNAEIGFQWNLGNLVKWGIIIVILIIFGVFAGNQLNAIRKGMTR